MTLALLVIWQNFIDISDVDLWYHNLSYDRLSKKIVKSESNTYKMKNCVKAF